MTCGQSAHLSYLSECLVPFFMILFKFSRKDTVRQSQVLEEYISSGRLYMNCVLIIALDIGLDKSGYQVNSFLIS